MSIEDAKKKAGYAAVDEYVRDNQVVGVGSGSTVVYAVERLQQRVKDEKLNIVCIPTSFQSTKLIREAGLVLGDLNTYNKDPVMDVAIDGADEVDLDLNCIKGGGGAQTQEKIIATYAKQLVIIADYRKESTKLGQQWRKGVPIEVIQLGYEPLCTRLQALGAKTTTLRMAKSKAGPVVTDNGHFIIDADFGEIEDPKSLNRLIRMLPGVVETGLFLNGENLNITKAFFGQKDGSVVTRIPK